MAPGLKIEIKGLKDLLATLGKLKAAGRRILRKAVDKGSKPILDAAKGAVAVETGLLKKSLGKKVKTYAKSGTVVAIIGPRKGAKLALTKGVLKGGKARKRFQKAQGRIPTLYAHLVERGAKPHAVGRKSSLRTGKQSGRMHPGAPAQPFLEPALKQNIAQAQNIMRDVIKSELEKEAAKARK